MVLTTDEGMKAACPLCHGVVKHKENCKVAHRGGNIIHADCMRDRFGNEATMDAKHLREQEPALQRIIRMLDFKNKPANKYGARRVA